MAHHQTIGNDTSMLWEIARAKINLALHVVGRRADGYHELDSLVAFADFGDRVGVAAADALSLAVTGPHAAGLSAGGDNLVMRAARALAALAPAPVGAAITLEKSLPVASGIGGGSADAAATLRALAALWRLDPAPDRLRAIALALGADVPACLRHGPVRMRGIGERLTRLAALPNCGVLLVNPNEALSTPAVFAARTGAFSPPLDLPSGWPDTAALATWLGERRNDLELPAVALRPAIAAVLAELRHTDACLLARMSGSGATCFGLYRTPDEATRAAAGLGDRGWWVRAGRLASDIPALAAHPGSA